MDRNVMLTEDLQSPDMADKEFGNFDKFINLMAQIIEKYGPTILQELD